MTRDFMDRLGAAIELGGMAGVQDDVAAVVAAARWHGLHGVALDVLADAGAPQVARWRALARLAPSLIQRTEADAATAAGITGELVLDAASC